MKMINLLIILILMICLSSFVTSIQVTPYYHNGNYDVQITGNESKWVESVDIIGRFVTITPKSLKDRTYMECETIKCDEKDKKEVVYDVPTEMEVTKTILGDKIYQEIDDKFYYIIPTYEHYIRFGKESVVLVEDISVNNTVGVNISFENNYTHLNITEDGIYADLVAYFPFDTNNPFPSTEDYSIKDFDGTLYNNPEYVTDDCMYRQCLKLNSSQSHYMKTGKDIKDYTGNRNKSISVWVKFGQQTVSEGNVYELPLVVGDASQYWGIHRGKIGGDPDRIHYYNYDNEDDTISENMVTDVWMHLVLTYNHTFGRILAYKDGVLLGSTASGATGSIAGDLQIGRMGTNYLNATLDELMIFNRTLSDNDVLDIFRNQSNRFSPEGYQQLFNINFTADGNSLNVTTETDIVNGSNISLKVHYYDGSWSTTASQYVGDGINNLTFTVTSSTTNVTLNYTFESTYGFETPHIMNDIFLNSYASLDTEYPKFTTIPDNITLKYDDYLAVVFVATDDFDISEYHVNDTIRFNMTATNGTLMNLTQLPTGNYTLNVTVNDTSNKVNSTIYHVEQLELDDIYPNLEMPANLTLSYGSSVNQNFTGYDNVDIDSFGANHTTVFTMFKNGTLINITELEAGTYTLNITLNDTSNNINSSIFEIVYQAFNNVPTHTVPFINATLDENYTYYNLTAYNQTTADADGETVKNIINWRYFNNSLTYLNMPFEGGAIAEGDTKTKDYSEYGRNGTVTSATASDGGGHDGFDAYDFNGADDYITIGKEKNFSDVCVNGCAFTAWIKKEGEDAGTIIARSDTTNSDDFFRLQVEADEDPTFTISEDGSTLCTAVNAGSNSITLNNWHHIAGVFNKSHALLYLNGELQENKSCSFNTVNEANWRDNEDTYIGARDETDRKGHFDGIIDDVVIYNRTISSQQIWALFTNQTDVVVSDETDYEQIWDACITPNDGIDDGETLCSNNLTINTQAKTPPRITIMQPATIIYSNNNITNVSMNITMNKNVSKCFYNINASNTTMGNNSMTRYGEMEHDLKYGEYTIEFYCNDTDKLSDTVQLNLSLHYYFENLTTAFTSSDNLKIVYETFFNATNQKPILLLTPYWDGNRSLGRSFAHWWQQRNEYFVVNMDVRGHGSSEGSMDVNKEECRDMVEAVEDAQEEFADFVNISSIYVGGTSGGSGRSLSCMNKYPDFYTASFAMFPMTNYSSWYNSSKRASIVTIFGDYYWNMFEKYESAGALTTAPNQFTPFLMMHNETDGTVNISESDQYNDSLFELGKSDYKYNRTAITHGDNPPEEEAKLWAHNYLQNFTTNLTIPDEADFKIASFVHTKNFSIWFDHMDKIGNVTFNMTADDIYLSIATDNFTGYSNISIYGFTPNTDFTVTLNGTTIYDDNLTSDSRGVLSINRTICQNYTNTFHFYIYTIPPPAGDIKTWIPQGTMIMKWVYNILELGLLHVASLNVTTNTTIENNITMHGHGNNDSLFNCGITQSGEYKCTIE